MLISWLRCNGILVSIRIPARHLLIPDMFQYSSLHSPSSSSKGRSFTHPSHPSLPPFIECWARESIWLPWVNVQKADRRHLSKKNYPEQSFWAGEWTLAKGRLSQGLAVQIPLAQNCDSEIFVSPTACQRGLDNFCKVPFTTHPPSATPRSPTPVWGLLADKNTRFPYSRNTNYNTL